MKDHYDFSKMKGKKNPYFKYNSGNNNVLNMAINNPEDRKKIVGVLSQISDSMTRIEAEREYQKEAISALSDDLSLDKKQVNKLASLYHKQNFQQVQQEQEELEELYESIIK